MHAGPSRLSESEKRDDDELRDNLSVDDSASEPRYGSERWILRRIAGVGYSAAVK